MNHSYAAGVDLEAELEGLVLLAIEAGQGPVPRASGSVSVMREVDEPVTVAILEALEDDAVMAVLVALLNTPAGAELKNRIAAQWASDHWEGICMARQDAADDHARECAAEARWEART